MDAPAHNAPDREFLIPRDEDIPMAGIAGTQQHALRQPAELLDGELAIDDGNDDAPVSRFDGTIHDEQIAIMDAEAGHRVSLHANEVGGFLMLDQVFVEAEARLEVIGGR